jgi:hypothetical protein
MVRRSTIPGDSSVGLGGARPGALVPASPSQPRPATVGPTYEQLVGGPQSLPVGPTYEEMVGGPQTIPVGPTYEQLVGGPVTLPVEPLPIGISPNNSTGAITTGNVMQRDSMRPEESTADPRRSLAATVVGVQENGPPGFTPPGPRNRSTSRTGGR